MKTIDESTELASEGGTQPLTLNPVIGSPITKYNSLAKHKAEELASDEIRVTVLGSGDPFVKIGQASASILIEVGNEQKDMFFFDGEIRDSLSTLWLLIMERIWSLPVIHTNPITIQTKLAAWTNLVFQLF